MTMSYVILIFLGLKISNIARGKSKEIKFPNLWIMPALFIFMIFEDIGKSQSAFSFLLIPILGIFAAIGILIGWIRGKSLSYHKNINGGVYYQESYLSLVIYILVIIVKWALNLFGGAGLSFISTGIIVLTCGSMIGRCGNISYNYLRAK